MQPNRRVRRINLKAIVASVVLLVVLPLVGLLIAYGMRGQVRSEALAQVEELMAQDRPDLALRHLSQYLVKHPDDPAILAVQARYLYETAPPPAINDVYLPEWVAAANANDRVLRLDPDGAQSTEFRERIADLYIRISNVIAAIGEQRSKDISAERVVGEYKFAPAVLLLQECVDSEKATAKTFRLLGEAKEGQFKLRTNLKQASSKGSLTDTELAEISAIRDAYSKALALDPKDHKATLLLALFNRSHGGSPAESDLLIREMLEHAPTDPIAYWTASKYYDSSGDQAKAAEAIGKAEPLAEAKKGELEPGEYLGIKLSHVKYLLTENKSDEARKVLGSLVETDRGPSMAWQLMGESYARENQLDKAIELWKEGVLKARPDGDFHYLLTNLASVYIERGEIPKATPLIERLRRLDRKESRRALEMVWLLEGQAAEKSGHHDEALKAYEAAYGKLSGPDKQKMLMGLGRSHQALGDYQKAERFFQDAEEVELDAANNALVYSNGPRLALANLKRMQRDYEGAARLLRSLPEASQDAEVKASLALTTLFNQAARPKADRDWATFEEALKSLGPESEVAARLNIQKDLIQADWKAAEAHAAEASARWPKSVEFWTSRAEVLLRTGDAAGALAVLEKASGPSNAGDQASLRIARSQILDMLGRGREALDLLSYSLGSLPVDQLARLHEARGRMCASRGDLAGAKEAFAAWATLQPGLAGPILAQLDLALTVGDQPMAWELLERLRKDSQKKNEDLQEKSENSRLYRLAYIEYLTKFPQAGKNRLTEARGIAQEMAEKEYPADARVHFAYARVLQLLGEDQTAISEYTTALKGGQEAALTPLVGLLAKAGRYGEISQFGRAGTPFGATSPERLATEFALAKGEKAQAAKMLAEVEKNYPASPALANWRLGIMDRLGRSEDVEKDIEQEITRDPSRISSWVALMRYQAARGRKAEARATLDRLVDRTKPDEKELVRAQGLEAIGESDEAEKVYRELLARPSASNETLLSAARFFLDTNHADEAEPLLRKVLAADPGNRAAARTLADRLSRHPDLSEAGWQKAMDTLGAENSSEAQGPEDRLTRAIVLARHPDRTRRREAIPLLEALVEDQPAGLPLTALAREALVKLYLADNRTDRAAEVAAVTATSSPNLNGIALYVESLLQAKNWTEASRQLDRLALLVPKDPNLAALRIRQIEGQAGEGQAVEVIGGAVRERSGQPDEIPFTIAAVRRLAQLQPDGDASENLAAELAAKDPKSSWLLAQLMATRKKFPQVVEAATIPATEGGDDQAFEACRALLTVIQAEGPDGPNVRAADGLFARALERFPNLAGMKALRGMSLHMLGRFDQEIQLYKELVASHPDNPVYNNNLAWALCESANNPEEALGYIDQAIRVFGRQPDLLDTRGVILTRLGRLPDAIVDLKEATERSPSPSPVFLFHLARAYKLSNQADLARATFAEGLKAGLSAASIEPFERPDLEALSKL